MSLRGLHFYKRPRTCRRTVLFAIRFGPHKLPLDPSRCGFVARPDLGAVCVGIANNQGVVEPKFDLGPRRLGQSRAANAFEAAAEVVT